MGQSFRNGDNGFGCDEDAIRRILLDNTGRVCTVFTQTGGCAGSGFTGIVSTIRDDACKLITSIPSAPTRPFSNGRNGDFNQCGCARFGSAAIIPLNRITCVVVPEV